MKFGKILNKKEVGFSGETLTKVVLNKVKFVVKFKKKKIEFTLLIFLLGTGEKGRQNLSKKISYLTSDLLRVNEDEVS